MAPKSAYVAPIQTSLQAINQMPYLAPSEPKTTALYQPPTTLSQANLSPGGLINAPVAPTPITMNSTNLSPWGTINNPTLPNPGWLDVAGAGGLNAPINNPANPLTTPGIAGGGGYGPGNALNPLMAPSTTLSPWGLINGPPMYSMPTTTGAGLNTTPGGTDGYGTGGIFDQDGGSEGGGYGSGGYGGGGNYYGSATGLIMWRIGT